MKPHRKNFWFLKHVLAEPNGQLSAGPDGKGCGVSDPARFARGGGRRSLREMYSSPRQYDALAALQTLPLIIASQARRNANLPLLGLQGAFLFACLVSLFMPQAEAGCLTLLAITLLLLRDAYQPVKCPSTGIAILEAQTVSMLIMLYLSCRNPGGVSI